MRKPHQTRRSTLSLLMLLAMTVYAGLMPGCFMGEASPDDPEWDTICPPFDETNIPKDELPTEPEPDCPSVGQVCGEDGVTYETRCAASRAHVRVDYAGECAPACNVDADCAAADLCNAAGRCEVANCPVLAPDDISQEVCGLDGFTYQTSCHARLARQRILHDGCCVE